MNDLSKLIYFGGVSENVGGMFMFLSVAAILVGLISIFYGAAMKDRERIGNDVWERGNNIQKKALWLVPLIAIPLMLVSVLLPSKDTVYAIAASEVGERVINTPTADKAVQALNGWLDKQMVSQKKKDDDE